MSNLEDLYEQAHAQTNDSKQYESKLLAIIQNNDAIESDENLKVKELCFYDLADLYIENNHSEQIVKLLQNNSGVLSQLPGAKSAKIMKSLVDRVAKSKKSSLDIQIELSEYVIEWSKQNERTHLRHKQQIKLSHLLLLKKKFKPAIDIITDLLVEIRKADDKLLLVEGQLVESKIYFALENFAKAKASLTSARASANQVYCEPQLQSDLDLQSGIIYSQDKDYKTGYSYYFEAFEALHSNKDDKAVQVLKYMILCKVMQRKYDDVAQLLGGKYGVYYPQTELEPIKAISKANEKKSLIAFQDVIKKHAQDLMNDDNIKRIADTLYEQLLEENLFTIIEPYEKVQISHISKKINLDTQTVQNKLSELILDKKIDGTLDQGNNCLILFNDLQCDQTYTNALEFMTSMNTVMDKLFERAKQIKA